MASIRLPAHLPSIKKALSFLKKCMARWAVDAELATRMELILDEALINIVRYAYPQGEAGDFEVRCSADGPGRLCLEVRDWGVPFNPLDRERPDPSEELTSRRVGGWGIEFMRRLTDEITYQHLEGANILTLCFISRNGA